MFVMLRSRHRDDETSSLNINKGVNMIFKEPGF